MEEPLFLAKYVAEWIEHTNQTMMLKSVDDEEKVKHNLGVNNNYTQVGHGGLRENTEFWFLTEEGIYELLMLSRKPIAKQWKKKHVLLSYPRRVALLVVLEGDVPLSLLYSVGDKRGCHTRSTVYMRPLKGDIS
ncbi:Bro-N domain-containing protein [Bacillus sp. S4]|uniref:BRO-N domain-containing protein n=1 Tax=Bacillus sp. S4 TaxID=125884 RepID=UPI00349F92F4